MPAIPFKSHGQEPPPESPDHSCDVLRFADCRQQDLLRVLRRLGLEAHEVAGGQEITGSFWGDEEAGLVQDRLYLRADTPVHSVLHEACHYACMDSQRREGLDTNAGGNYDEENAVCYLQILLADEISGMGRQRMMRDMDRWGYSFRLGSARDWFERDAADAELWLKEKGLLDKQGKPTWRLR